MSMQATIVSYVLAYVLAWGLEAMHNLKWYENLGPAKSTPR